MTADQFLRELQERLLPGEYKLCNAHANTNNREVSFMTQRRLAKLIFEICYRNEFVKSINFVPISYQKCWLFIELE